MHISNLSKIGLLSFLSIAVFSCKKPSNGIDNNSILETPYALFVSDSGGSLYKTNDGVHFNSNLFPADGFPSRALCWSGANIFMVKNNCYYSYDNGVNFNLTFDTVQTVGNGAVNQSLILQSLDEKRVYLAENPLGKASPRRFNMGITYSEKDGIPHSWVCDSLYDTVNILGPVMVSSFTELKNDTIMAYDETHNRLFARGNATARWIEILQPDNTFAPLPTGGLFTLGHLNNEIEAIDYYGVNGAWYSDNGGRGWFKYTGLPNLPLLSVASPFDQVLLVGTNGDGVYRLEQNTHNFVASNSGLAPNTIVRAIVAKQNYYKNGGTTQYIYLATNNGLYQSIDGGHNWIMTAKGNYYSAY